MLKCGVEGLGLKSSKGSNNNNKKLGVVFLVEFNKHKMTVYDQCEEYYKRNIEVNYLGSYKKSYFLETEQ